MGISSLIYDSWKTDSQYAKYRGMLPMIKQVTLSGKTLDIGIGTGLFEEFLRGEGINLDVVGIDPDPLMLKEAKNRGFNAVLGMAEKLPFEDSSFDFLICIDTIHHTHEPEKAVSEMNRVLKPEGHILISKFCNTFNKTEVLAELERLMGAFEILDKRVVGKVDNELTAVLLCRK